MALTPTTGLSSDWEQRTLGLTGWGSGPIGYTPWGSEPADYGLLVAPYTDAADAVTAGLLSHWFVVRKEVRGYGKRFGTLPFGQRPSAFGVAAAWTVGS